MNQIDKKKIKAYLVERERQKLDKKAIDMSGIDNVIGFKKGFDNFIFRGFFRNRSINSYISKKVKAQIQVANLDKTNKSWQELDYHRATNETQQKNREQQIKKHREQNPEAYQETSKKSYNPFNWLKTKATDISKRTVSKLKASIRKKQVKTQEVNTERSATTAPKTQVQKPKIAAPPTPEMVQKSVQIKEKQDQKQPKITHIEPIKSTPEQKKTWEFDFSAYTQEREKEEQNRNKNKDIDQDMDR